MSLKKFWHENRGFILFFSLLLMARSSFADWYHVPTGSMQPNIVEGDRILVNKMAYRLDVPFTDIALTKQSVPARGDVVVFESAAADERMVKRVIGIEGDLVALVNNQLVVNGEVADYQSKDGFIYQETLGSLQRDIQILPIESKQDSFKGVRVPKDHVLVLGDNRNNSADSRYYGFIPLSEISGKALKVIASLNPDNYYLPRSDRFLQAL